MIGWNYLLYFFIAALVLSSVGFYKYVYFLSIGYGFAIAGLGVMMLIMFGKEMKTVSIIGCVLFIVYGARLSGFLLYREIKSASYRKTMKDDIKIDKPIPFFVKLAIWITVAVLYAIQVSPVFYRVYNGSTDAVLPYIAIAISAIALVIETLADIQKDQQKKVNPNKVATEGLYKIVRCPNYFGEILFWTGVFVGGITTYQSVGQWIIASLSYVSIVYVMFNGAQRLEKRQMGHYGNNADYQAYVNKTPIIIPLVPIYHLNKQI